MVVFSEYPVIPAMFFAFLFVTFIVASLPQFVMVVLTALATIPASNPRVDVTFPLTTRFLIVAPLV